MVGEPGTLARDDLTRATITVWHIARKKPRICGALDFSNRNQINAAASSAGCMD